MKQVMLESIQPGMITAKDVQDRNGRIILKAGTAVGENHIRIFKLWRITSIFVEETAGAAEPQPEKPIDPALQKKLEIKFRQLFRNANLNDAFTKQLYTYCFQRAARGGRRSGGARAGA